MIYKLFFAWKLESSALFLVLLCNHDSKYVVNNDILKCKVVFVNISASRGPICKLFFHWKLWYPVVLYDTLVVLYEVFHKQHHTKYVASYFPTMFPFVNISASRGLICKLFFLPGSCDSLLYFVSYFATIFPSMS